jgi:hypothetical protein
VSPSGTIYHEVCVRVPVIRPDCLIDWCMPWSVRVLESVARESFVGADPWNVPPAFLRLYVAMHRSVEDRAIKFLAETKHVVAMTPSRYFQLVSVFNTQIARNETGVEKIQATPSQIAEMNEEIDRDIPMLEPMHGEVEGMLAELALHHREVASAAAAVEERSRTAETEVTFATAANAVAQDPVQRLDKYSLVNIQKLHATSAGMKCSFDAIHMMVESAPRRGRGPRRE